jgi:hypothetical protein
MIHAWLRLSFANSIRKKRRIPLVTLAFPQATIERFVHEVPLAGHFP